MPHFNWTFDMGTIVGHAITVALILGIAWVITTIAATMIRKAITARIPRVREESPEQLAARSQTLSGVTVKAVNILVWTIAFITILSEFGVNISALLATVGVASLALGFAAQNIIRDYLYGFFIISEDWYRVGEVANVAGIGGQVVDIQLRRTVLRDLDGALHNIPNGQIQMGSNLTRDFGRVNLDIEVGYGEDLERVMRVINDECAQLKADPTWGPNLITEPAAVRVNALGASGIAIKVLGDTKPMQQWAVMGELRLRLKKRFDTENIEIPWPHTKVYFGNAIPSRSEIGY